MEDSSKIYIKRDVLYLKLEEKNLFRKFFVRLEILDTNIGKFR